MVELLEDKENIIAVELGFAPLLSDDILLTTLEMCSGELPLIFSIPHEQILTLGPRLIQAGASAISISPPRGRIYDRDSSLVSGRMFGPSLLPRTLEIVHSAGKLGIPIIANGGIWTLAEAKEMISAGALAAQIDAGLWIPHLPANS